MAVRPVLADGSVEDVIGTVVGVDPDGLVYVNWPDVGRRAHAVRGHLLPDLTDHATAGVLLGWLAETGRWSWENYGGQHAVWNTDAMEGEVFRSRVFGEAVARALLAVWGPA